MNAIDNSNLKNYRTGDTVDFVPALSFVYDFNAAEIDFTEGSTFPSGKALLKTKISVFDKFGGEVRGFILPTSGSDSGHDGETTISVSALDRSKGLDVKATVICDDDMLVADGIATNIQASGSLGSWDSQRDARTTNP